MYRREAGGHRGSRRSGGGEQGKHEAGGGSADRRGQKMLDPAHELDIGGRAERRGRAGTAKEALESAPCAIGPRNRATVSRSSAMLTLSRRAKSGGLWRALRLRKTPAWARSILVNPRLSEPSTRATTFAARLQRTPCVKGGSRSPRRCSGRSQAMPIGPCAMRRSSPWREPAKLGSSKV